MGKLSKTLITFVLREVFSVRNVFHRVDVLGACGKEWSGTLNLDHRALGPIRSFSAERETKQLNYETTFRRGWTVRWKRD